MFADGTKNVNVENVIKRNKSIKKSGTNSRNQ